MKDIGAAARFGGLRKLLAKAHRTCPQHAWATDEHGNPACGGKDDGHWTLGCDDHHPAIRAAVRAALEVAADAADTDWATGTIDAPAPSIYVRSLVRELFPKRGRK